MSKTEKDNEFYEMADAHIALANQQSKNINQGKVSATFLYAAARFNTFIVASNADSADDFSENRENAIEYFMTEYRKMLEEHFADYQQNYEKYIGNKNKTIN